jgi:hypothetical protein
MLAHLRSAAVAAPTVATAITAAHHPSFPLFVCALSCAGSRLFVCSFVLVPATWSSLHLCSFTLVCTCLGSFVCLFVLVRTCPTIHLCPLSCAGSCLFVCSFVLVPVTWPHLFGLCLGSFGIAWAHLSASNTQLVHTS